MVYVVYQREQRVIHATHGEYNHLKMIRSFLIILWLFGCDILLNGVYWENAGPILNSWLCYCYFGELCRIFHNNSFKETRNFSFKAHDRAPNPARIVMKVITMEQTPWKQVPIVRVATTADNCFVHVFVIKYKLVLNKRYFPILKPYTTLLYSKKWCLWRRPSV